MNDLVSEVTKITSKPIKVVYDSISLVDTQKAGWSLLASGGRFILVLPPVEGITHGKDDKSVVNVYGNVNIPGQGDIGRELYARLCGLLADGSIKARFWLMRTSFY